MKNINLKKYKNFDWILLGSAMGIFLLGLLFLFSSTYPYNTDYVLRQVTWFLLGVLVFIAVVNVNYRRITGVANVFYFLTIFLLVHLAVVDSVRRGGFRLDFSTSSLQNLAKYLLRFPWCSI